jgi:hypothetical protein
MWSSFAEAGLAIEREATASAGVLGSDSGDPDRPTMSGRGQDFLVGIGEAPSAAPLLSN